MIRIKHLLLLPLLLLPLVFASCDSEPARINIVQKGDYSKLLEAVRSTDQSLSAKLELIENALTGGLAGDRQAIELIEEAIKALEGTLAEKLTAIGNAIKDGNTSLETRLALLEAAARSGFTDAGEQQSLLLQALQSMEGSLDEKLAAIAAAVESQTTSLETRIGLIEAAVHAGFADYAQAQELAAQAIESMGKTAEEKLAAVKAAVGDLASSLEAKLLLIETAFENGFAQESDRQQLIQAAIEALDGGMEDKLAAIQAAMASQTSGLETKIALIVSSIENGFSGVDSAIGNLQQALDTSLEGLDSSLSTLSSDVSAKLQSISGQISASELSKALQDVLSSAESGEQSTETIIKSIQKVLDAIQTTMGAESPVSAILYMGHPTEPVTVSVGHSFTITLRVNPSSATLTEDMLSMECQDSTQFFLPGTNFSKAVKTHYKNTSLAPDPDNPGQYFVTVNTIDDPLYKYWDESRLVFKVVTGYVNNKPQYVCTQPIPVAIMPNPGDGLNLSGIDKSASFMISRGKEPTLGSIYLPLTSVEFTDGSESRTYTAEFLKSAVFDNVNKRKIKSVLDKEKRFAMMYPDTTDHGWDVLKDSTTVNCIEVLGFLDMEDRWGGTCSPFLSPLSWHTFYTDSTLVKPYISPDGTLKVYLGSKANDLGLNVDDCPGSTFCSASFVFASAGGAWLDANFLKDSWDLEMRLMEYPSGSRFTVDAVITQTVQPSENNPSFRPAQRKGRIRVNLKFE